MGRVSPHGQWRELVRVAPVVSTVHLVDDGSGNLVFDDTGPSEVELEDDGSGTLVLEDAATDPAVTRATTSHIFIMG